MLGDVFDHPEQTFARRCSCLLSCGEKIYGRTLVPRHDGHDLKGILGKQLYAH
ncbi:hypothetical protein D3C85_1403030 [compost metagenome]